ncbi:Gfo/Idh/MocA family protein [Paenibacillus chartarius]|uniref:Gfo/Idh/MocA family protein n=1 Tax=Paenibacillus chartarius TaxID=747481 RepID=A0ABV6DPG1_9BACL
MRKRRIGIVGLGDIARKVYLPLLTSQESVEIVGLQSRTKETVDRIGGQYRIDGRYTDLGDLVALQPDAVFVHSPTPTHYEIVMACLQAGIHVYVDKPLSYDLGESVRMAEEAAKRGLLLGVGFNRRFAPLYAEAKSWLEGAGGASWCSVQKHRLRKQLLPARETVYDDLIHMLDLLVWLGDGEDGELAAAELEADIDGKMVRASGTVRLTGRGATGVYAMVRDAGRDLEKLELHGSGRSAEVVNMETGEWTEAGGMPVLRTFGSWDTVLERRGFAGVVNHFLACLDDPDRCTVRADRVLASHRLAERVAAGKL